MKLSRILGTDMTLLSSLRFIIDQTRGIKTISRFYKVFDVNCDFLSFLGENNPYSPVNRRFRLYRSFLLRRFLTIGCCSIPINITWGGIK